MYVEISVSNIMNIFFYKFNLFLYFNFSDRNGLYAKQTSLYVIVRPLFFNFLVYGFLGGKNGSVGRKKIKNKKNSKGPIMSSCRKKLPVHGNSIKK